MKPTSYPPKRVFLILLLFIIMISSVSALVVNYDQILFEENCDFTDTYTAQGYSELSNYGTAPTSPIDYSYVGSEFTKVCGEDDSLLVDPNVFLLRQINAWAGDDMIDTSKKVILSFDYYDNNIGGKIPYNSVITFTHDNFNEQFFKLHFLNNTKAWNISNYMNPTALDCYTDTMVLGQAHQMVLFIDYPNDVYSFYIDGVCSGTCCNQVLGVPDANAGTDGINIRWDSGHDGINKFIDNLKIGYGVIDLGAFDGTTCSSPNAFCDDFNRPTPHFNEGWFPYSLITIDTGFSPVNNLMELNGSLSPRTMLHEVDRYPVEYTTTSQTIITRSTKVPVSTSEFIFRAINNNNMQENDSLIYAASSGSGNNIYEVKIEYDGDVMVRDDLTDPDSYLGLCTNCLTNLNNTYLLSISTYFSSELHPELEDLFTTIHNDSVKMSIQCVNCTNNDINVFDTQPFLDSRAYDIRTFQIKINDDSQYIIDDYYVFTGLNKESSTLNQHIEQLFISETVNRTMGQDDDLTEIVVNFWETWGLKSSGSKILFGMVLIFFADIFILGWMIQSHNGVNTKGILMIDIVMLLLGTFAGLFPVWVLIVLGIISGGIAFFSSSKSIQGE